jgi:hypothetical protein
VTTDDRTASALASSIGNMNRRAECFALPEVDPNLAHPCQPAKAGAKLNAAGKTGASGQRSVGSQGA